MNKRQIAKLIAAGATISPSRPARNPEGRNKYGNEKTVVDGFTFASKREANRWSELRLLLKVGEIVHLHRQVPYDIVINDILVCRYTADFVYQDKNGSVVEDAKGVKTGLYGLKKKLMKAVLGIEIVEV